VLKKEEKNKSKHKQNAMSRSVELLSHPRATGVTLKTANTKKNPNTHMHVGMHPHPIWAAGGILVPRAHALRDALGEVDAPKPRDGEEFIGPLLVPCHLQERVQLVQDVVVAAHNVGKGSEFTRVSRAPMNESKFPPFCYSPTFYKEMQKGKKSNAHQW